MQTMLLLMVFLSGPLAGTERVVLTTSSEASCVQAAEKLHQLTQTLNPGAHARLVCTER